MVPAATPDCYCRCRISAPPHLTTIVSHWHRNQGPPSFEVIVDGTHALHARLRSLLDIRVTVVGDVQFSLLSKVQYDIGDSCSLDNLIDCIFSLFRKHIEPELHHAQSESEQPVYSFLKNEAQIDNLIEMYLRPPSASEEERLMTGLRDKDRKMVEVEVARLVLTGPWLTKSYLKMILDSQCVPRLNTPLPLASRSLVTHKEPLLVALKPFRICSDLVNRDDDISQPWT
ncbi:hypothetical protein Tco_0618601 [Tanacetum coccineum]